MTDLYTPSDAKLKSFIASMEAQAFMGNIDPDQLPIIATCAMQLAAQNQATGSDEKAKAQAYYLMIILALRDIAIKIVQLEEEIDDLLDRQQQLIDEIALISERLNQIDDLIGADGEYNRDQAVALIKEATGKSPDPDLSDTDIQALLKLVEEQQRKDMTTTERGLDDIKGQIQDKRDQLEHYKGQAHQYQQALSNSNIPLPQLEAVSLEAKRILQHNGSDNISSKDINAEVDGLEHTADTTLEGLNF